MRGCVISKKQKLVLSIFVGVEICDLELNGNLNGPFHILETKTPARRT